jgi:glyoxylase-like metal-dependent hydrolase (beta-lactamase superfamily II)
MIKIQKFIFNSFSENTYLVWDENSMEALIIDPGCHSRDEEETLVQFIADNKIRIKFMINTHCHIDHVLGNRFIKEKFNPLFLAPEKDIPLLQNLKMQSEMVGFDEVESPMPDEFINEKMEIFLGDEKFNFVETPGHTPGEFCLYSPTNKILFSGDVLFYETIGRTDIWGGNFEVLINSIKNKLLSLDRDTVVFPGHGEPTTIEHEILNNEFLK